VGLTAAGSTLGNIIPPSLMMIIYAASAGISVGAMFLSGIVPGILIGIGQMIWSYYVARRHGIGKVASFSTRRLLSSGRSAWPSLLIPLIVIGGILAGVFTATEASVIAVLYVLLLSVVRRRLTGRSLFA
jgi:TRAP-type C4-dicarboxylate transport system permease large subunit